MPTIMPLEAKRRKITLEFRIRCTSPKGLSEVMIIYPGQFKHFCKLYGFNYNSLMSARLKWSDREIPMYLFGQKKGTAKYYLMPARSSQITPCD